MIRRAAIGSLALLLTSSACGGGPAIVSWDTRRAAQALARGERPALPEATARELVALAEEAMAVHADFEA